MFSIAMSNTCLKSYNGHNSLFLLRQAVPGSSVSRSVFPFVTNFNLKKEKRNHLVIKEQEAISSPTKMPPLLLFLQISQATESIAKPAFCQSRYARKELRIVSLRLLLRNLSQLGAPVWSQTFLRPVCCGNDSSERSGRFKNPQLECSPSPARLKPTPVSMAFHEDVRRS